MDGSATPPNTRRALPTQFEDFKDFHAGETILVCGCGQSLGLVSEPERLVTIGG